MDAKSRSKIILLGAGGHGKSILSVAQAVGLYFHGILDDKPETWGQTIHGVSVLGPVSTLNDYPDNLVLAGFGDNAKRREVVERFPDANWTTVFGKYTHINPNAKIGIGTVIFPFSIIGADVQLGNHVIISSHVTLGHDAIIENYAQIAPGVQIGGAASVGHEAMLGLGSIVCPKVQIGEKVILGAGAVAVSDIPSRCTAFGVPAKVRKGD